MRFLVIKKTEYDNLIIDMLKVLLGNNIKCDYDENNLIITHDYDNNEDIKQSLIALGNDYINILAYLSNSGDDQRLKREYFLVKPLLATLSFGIYDFKSLLLVAEVTNKSEILNYIISKSGVDEEFILQFCECDLNTSKASKVMFRHRNTIIYQINNLYETSGFDLKCFKDAHILYSLIEK